MVQLTGALIIRLTAAAAVTVTVAALRAETFIWVVNVGLVTVTVAEVGSLREIAPVGHAGSAEMQVSM